MKIRLLTCRVTADPKEDLQPRGTVLDTGAGEISEGDAQRLLDSRQAELVGKAPAKPKAPRKPKAAAKPKEPAKEPEE